MNIKAILFPDTLSPFRRNFRRVAGANLVALLLPLLATPLLTRLYAPSDYGVLAVFVAVLGLVSAVCTARFDWIMPNAGSSGVAAALAIAGCTAVLATALLVTIVVAIGQWTADISPLWWLLPIALMGIGARSLLSGWFVRANDLSPTSRAAISRSVTNVALALLGGLLRLGAPGLAFANVVAAWMGVGTMMRRADPAFRSSLRRTTFRRIRASIRIHLRSATWSILVALVNATSLNLPLLILAVFYDAREVGWYAIMMRVVMTPTRAFAGALGSSFWAHAAEHVRANRIAELATDYRRTTGRLVVASIPVAMVCLGGPFFVGPLLGDADWRGAGWVLLAMTPLFLGSLIFSPTNHLVVLDRQHLQLIADTLRLTGASVAIWLAHELNLPFVVAVAAASTASCIGHLVVFLSHIAAHRSRR